MKWFKYNHQLFNGTVVIRLAPRVRIGDRMVFAGDLTGGGKVPEFYIQSVQHNYMFGQDATSTIGLVRGGYNLIKKTEAKADMTSREASIEIKKDVASPKIPKFGIVLSRGLLGGPVHIGVNPIIGQQ